MTDKKQRGGKREGAGRPAEVPCRKLCVYLDEQTIDRLRRLGAGNLSAGIRAANTGQRKQAEVLRKDAAALDAALDAMTANAELTGACAPKLKNK